MLKALHDSYRDGVYAGAKFGRGYGCRPVSPRYVVLGIGFGATDIRLDRWAVQSDYLLIDPPDGGVASELWHQPAPADGRLPINAAVALACVDGIGWSGDGLHASGTVLECHTLELYSVEPGRETDVAPCANGLERALSLWLAEKYPAELATLRLGCSRWEDSQQSAAPVTDVATGEPVTTSYEETPDGIVRSDELSPQQRAELLRLVDDGNPHAPDAA